MDIFGVLVPSGGYHLSVGRDNRTKIMVALPPSRTAEFEQAVFLRWGPPDEVVDERGEQHVWAWTEGDCRYSWSNWASQDKSILVARCE